MKTEEVCVLQNPQRLISAGLSHVFVCAANVLGEAKLKAMMVCL